MSSSSTEQLLRVRRTGFTMIVGIIHPYLNSEEDVAKVGAELLALVEGKKYPKLVITFDGVRFISSSMLGYLVRLQRAVAKAQGKLRVCALTPALKEILKASHLDKTLDVYENEDAALVNL